MRRLQGPVGGLLICMLAWNALAPQASGNDVYPSFDAAMAAATPFMKDRDYKAAQAPLEAAVRLANGDSERLLRVYNNLTACYRLLPDTDRMTEACEFTIAATKEDSQRLGAAQTLSSFMYQRGKIDETRKLYEERLAQTPGDLVALSMLASLNSISSKDRDKAKTYKAQLEKVQQKRNGKYAEEEEGQAAAEPAKATEHWKQAAVYWSRAAEPANAIRAAKKAEAAGPDMRSELLRHFWHAQIADVYLKSDAPADAIRHYKQAIETTKIAGYKDACQKKMDEAKAKLEEKKP